MEDLDGLTSNFPGSLGAVWKRDHRGGMEAGRIARLLW